MTTRIRPFLMFEGKAAGRRFAWINDRHGVSWGLKLS
jgi:predicted 3-demethylubiquinone-9 3-methyltransferase (glyoxalase superfamily)